ncbi:U-box domain-containing protein 35 [Oryza brachyantha]|uniref:RING-type E3 ubiquitin transferase n=1 Tax=Oryza brachyantha TaxID=4533 RepID=J3MB46_ORYBR|nr:U-box domain-containing protein 35 [Oryza brachyantha]XP_040381156.1 U-box domain-containing protein 35 [Oryza brachyantha]XP_040381157.1 U-box domain-containing protein 35 [Oryza brachyantha]
MEIQEAAGAGEDGLEMEAPSVSTVAIAVNGSKSSRHALKWALDKFVPEGRVLFRILHVRPIIKMVPTPMGNFIPITQVREDVATAYRKDVEWQANNMLLPYKKMCAQRKVEAEAVLLESDDVPTALSEEINKFNVSKLVLGSSSSIFRRKHKGSKTASRICECIPSFCTAYVVSKGKLSSVHSATSDNVEAPESISSSTVSSPSSRSLASSVPSEWGDTYGSANVTFHQSSLSSQRDQALANMNKLYNRTGSPSGSGRTEISYHDDTVLTSSHSVNSEAQFSSSSSGKSIYKSFNRDHSFDNSDQASVSDIATNLKHSHDQEYLKLEIDRLRVKLRHLQKLNEIAQNESFDASQKLHKLGIQDIEDEIKLKESELTEEKVRRLIRKKEREQQEVARREDQFKSDSAEREAKQNNDIQEGDENKTEERIFGRCFDEYNRYTWEEIQASTSSFSVDLMIGKGSYGTVYKAKFHHTVAAVKVLNSPEGCGTQQLQQELEVLGKIRHPHLLLMLGACPEHGCLVYEYMENGSLDDMLQRRNNTPSLTWFDRLRIAWEVATALMFLHSSKPEPIIHRDLKPANILLDRNLVSKIGDVGLSTLLPSMDQYLSTMIKNTAPVGTFCYIDPEYQRTGVVSMKSDVYALGIVILQLLTAKSPMGIAHVVETALEEGHFLDILDASAGQWPQKEAQELAVLALKCAEMRRRDRPDLSDHVLPALERLKDVAAKAREMALHGQTPPPSHFICPILQEVMVDPYVASDGYTYDRKAIELWLSMNDKSPMTNLRLPHKNLIPNHSLRSAIMDWRSKG